MLVADALAHFQHIGHLACDGRIAPAVDLEGRVAHLLALDREVGEGFGRVEAAVLVAVIGGGVGRQRLSIAAQQFPDRRVVELAGDIPQRDVDQAHAHAVVLAQRALDIVVELLALERIASQQIVGVHLHLRKLARAAGHVFAGDALVGVDLQDVARAA